MAEETPTNEGAKPSPGATPDTETPDTGATPDEGNGEKLLKALKAERQRANQAEKNAVENAAKLKELETELEGLRRRDRINGAIKSAVEKCEMAGFQVSVDADKIEALLNRVTDEQLNDAADELVEMLGDTTRRNTPEVRPAIAGQRTTDGNPTGISIKNMMLLKSIAPGLYEQARENVRRAARSKKG